MIMSVSVAKLLIVYRTKQDGSRSLLCKGFEPSSRSNRAINGAPRRAKGADAVSRVAACGTFNK